MKRTKKKLSQALATAAVSASLAIVPAASAQAHSQSVCTTGQICLGRASYTDETSGTSMYGFTISNYQYVNLINYHYQSGLNMANKSWRVRNRSSAQKACSYGDVNYGDLRHTEAYSSTRKWNADLPDDVVESFMAVGTGQTCA